MRLNKYLAFHGVGARRTCDEFIREGRIRVNGCVVRELGTQVKVGQDRVEVDGKRLELTRRLVYILLNKPAGYVVTAKDPRHRPTVFDFLKDIEQRVFPVGRLDLDVQGLLLLTNDGALSFRLTHPRFQVEKVYRVVVEGRPEGEILRSIRSGLRLDDGPTAPADVKQIGGDDRATMFEMRMHEGRKRQIKRMWSALGHPVLALERISFAGLTTKGLAQGEWRFLEREEIEKLKERAGLLREVSVE